MITPKKRGWLVALTDNTRCRKTMRLRGSAIMAQARLLKLTLGTLGMLCTSTAVVAQTPENASAFLEGQLRCFSNSDSIAPTPLLLYFLRQGLIKLSDEGGGDSISCWHLTRIFIADGLPIKAICALDDDPLVIAEYPSLYHRESGTAESQITIFTDAKDDVVERWLKLNLDGPHNSFSVGKPGDAQNFLPYSFSSGTHISCDALSSGGVPQSRNLNQEPSVASPPPPPVAASYTCKDLVLAHLLSRAGQDDSKEREITNWMSLTLLKEHPEFSAKQDVQTPSQIGQIVGEWCADNFTSGGESADLSKVMDSAFHSISAP